MLQSFKGYKFCNYVPWSVFAKKLLSLNKVYPIKYQCFSIVLYRDNIPMYTMVYRKSY